MHYDGMPLQKQIALTLRVIIVCCSIYYVHHIFVLFRDGNASNNASKISGIGPIDVERYYLSTSSECQHIVNSRAFHIDCMPVPASLYPVLITGLGGCGSHNIANLFDRMGVELPHEGLGRDGSVSWFYAVNDVLVRGRYPHRARLQGNTYQSPRFENVLHLLRCPMQHISSFTSHLNASYDFVQTHMLQQINSLSSVPSNSVARSAQHHSIQNNILHLNSMPCSREASIWCSRNYTDFFFRRKSIIMEPENRWPRGSKHWLHFSALSWLFWNSHIQRYSGSHYRIETDLDLLVSKCLLSIEQSKNNSLSSDSLSTVQNRQNRKKSWLSLLPSKKRKKQRVSSIKHKLHGNYSLSDIDLLDHELGMEIRILSLHFGYDIESRVKVNDADNLNLIQSSQYDTLRSTLKSTLKSTFRSNKSSVPSPVSDTVQSHVQLHKCY